MDTLYLLLSCGTAGWISYQNSKNIDLSPKYRSGDSRLRLAFVSILKGGIYGYFTPLSLMWIAWDAIYHPNSFQRHFIPLSVWGS